MRLDDLSISRLSNTDLNDYFGSASSVKSAIEEIIRLHLKIDADLSKRQAVEILRRILINRGSELYNTVSRMRDSSMRLRLEDNDLLDDMNLLSEKNDLNVKYLSSDVLTKFHSLRIIKTLELQKTRRTNRFDYEELISDNIDETLDHKEMIEPITENDTILNQSESIEDLFASYTIIDQFNDLDDYEKEDYCGEIDRIISAGNVIKSTIDIYDIENGNVDLSDDQMKDYLTTIQTVINLLEPTKSSNASKILFKSFVDSEYSLNVTNLFIKVYHRLSIDESRLKMKKDIEDARLDGFEYGEIDFFYADESARREFLETLSYLLMRRDTEVANQLLDLMNAKNKTLTKEEIDSNVAYRVLIIDRYDRIEIKLAKVNVTMIDSFDNKMIVSHSLLEKIECV
jgi:hypothetical protein